MDYLLPTGLCCAAVVTVLGLAGVAWWFSSKKSATIAAKVAPTEEDIKRELAVSLAVMIQEGTPPSGATSPVAEAQAMASASQFSALLDLARTWKTEGGKPKNAGQFNDLLRALEAIA